MKRQSLQNEAVRLAQLQRQAILRGYEEDAQLAYDFEEDLQFFEKLYMPHIPSVHFFSPDGSEGTQENEVAARPENSASVTNNQ